ncbi:MAG: ABC transporter permease [Vicinamibacterales bacterium]
MRARSLLLRLRALLRPSRAERDLHDELSFHIAREARKLVDQGLDPDEARRLATRRFGSVTATADACRDERGTTFVETTAGDIRYACRTIARTPLTSVTIIGTVGLGLGLVTVLFTVLNVLLFRVDAVPRVDEMVAVERPRGADGERERFTRADFEALRRDTRPFSGAFAELAGIDTRIDGRMMAVTLVSGNAFEVMEVGAAMGRTLLPSDEDPAQTQPVVVLSDTGWERQFARDPAIVGRSIAVNGSPHVIVGVMPAGFRGLAVGAPDLWAPLSSLADFQPRQRDRTDQAGLDIVARLGPGVDAEAARAQVEARLTPAGPHERAAAAVRVVPHVGTIPQPLEAVVVFTPLFIAFGLVLLIGCANVANLLLARGVSRQREIGVRLALGAARSRIARQWLAEGLLLALAAAGVAFLAARLALHATITAVLSTMPPDLGDVSLAVPPADWRVALFLLAGAVVSTALFGLLPALHATRVEPMRSLRGEAAGGARPGRSREALVALQVAAATLLLICAAVFLRSAMASAAGDPGLRTSDTIVIDIGDEPRRAELLRAIASAPVVAATAAEWPSQFGVPRPALAEAPGAKGTVRYKLVEPAYFDVLDIPLVRGRVFGPDDGAVAIVTEQVAATLFPGVDPIGLPVRLAPETATQPDRDEHPRLPAQTVTVIGVARDVRGFEFAERAQPGLYLPTSADAPGTTLVARVHGDPDIARQRLLDELTRVDPNMGQVWTLRTIAGMATYFLRMAFWVTVVLGGLALALTLSGLFGVVSYLVQQRTREIGVRMALGATSHGVTRLVVSQTAAPVGLGVLVGLALAGAAAAVLMALPGAGGVSSVVHAADPVAYGASVLLIVVACLLAAILPALEAARLDPMETLRHD